MYFLICCSFLRLEGVYGISPTARSSASTAPSFNASRRSFAPWRSVENRAAKSLSMPGLLFTVRGSAQERLGVERSHPIDCGLPTILVGIGEDVQTPAEVLQLPHLRFAYVRSADGNGALTQCSDG